MRRDSISRPVQLKSPSEVHQCSNYYPVDCVLILTENARDIQSEAAQVHADRRPSHLSGHTPAESKQVREEFEGFYSWQSGSAIELHKPISQARGHAIMEVQLNEN